MIDIQLAKLPYPLQGQPFNQLSEQRRCFFIDREYLPLPDSHALQIILLDKKSTAQVKSLVWARLRCHQTYSFKTLPQVKRLNLHDKWNSESELQSVRQWLYDLGIPFSRRIFLYNVCSMPKRNY